MSEADVCIQEIRKIRREVEEVIKRTNKVMKRRADNKGKLLSIRKET